MAINMFPAQFIFVYVDILSILILPVPSGLPSIDNGAHGTGKLPIKTQVSDDIS